MRQQIIDGLNACTDGQRNIFMRIYSPENLNASIDNVVSTMPKSKLKQALKQVKCTVEKNNLPKPEPIPEPPIESTLEERILPYALELAESSFYKTMSDSPRSHCGGAGKIDFIFENKEFLIEWEGYWENGEWFDYWIKKNGVNKRGAHFL